MDFWPLGGRTNINPIFIPAMIVNVHKTKKKLKRFSRVADFSDNSQQFWHYEQCDTLHHHDANKLSCQTTLRMKKLMQISQLYQLCDGILLKSFDI